MKFKLYIFLLCLLPTLIFAVQPISLQVVDLRSKVADADFMTKMMSLQGAINRQVERNLPAIFLIRSNSDSYWADVLTNTYRLKRENLSADQVIEANKANLKFQVLYTATDKPWNRSVAVAFAGVSDEAAIATTEDLGLPALDFPKDGWDNRVDAYKWEKQNIGEKAVKEWLGLLPENGSAILDLVAVNKMMAIDLDPAEEAEKALLEEFIKDVKDGGKIIGYPDKRVDSVDTAQVNLMEIIGDRDLRYLPARTTGNLSCFMRFESVRPYRQWRDEIVPFKQTEDKKYPNWLVLIYDGGNPNYDGAQSIDNAMSVLALLDDSAIKKIPVGIEVPMTINELAPPIYSQLIARQRSTMAELLAAPNGDGYALPISMADNSNYIIRSAEIGKKLDLNSVVSFDNSAESKKCKGLYDMMSAAGWRSTFLYPTKNFTEKRAGTTGAFAGFAALLGFDSANSPADLMKILDTKNESSFRVVFINPNGIPPAVLKGLLPEIEKTNTVISPSQAVRELEEYTRVNKLLDGKGRGEPTLIISTPVVVGGEAPQVYSPITVNVRVSAGGGAPNVMLARLQYETPDGRVGAVDMVKTGKAKEYIWTAIVPPSLQEGTYRIRARMVDGVQAGISYSPALEIKFAAPDLDGDGANDAWESYLGTNPAKADTDGDGLPDGIDPQPLIRNTNIQPLTPSYSAPADKMILADPGTSVMGNDGRDIPAGTTIIYKLPVGDIGTNIATLRIVTASVVENAGRSNWVTEVKYSKLSPEILANGSMNIKFPVQDKAIKVLSVGLISNPKGPFLDNMELTCADKRAIDILPGKMPIAIKAVVYSPLGISEAKLMYGSSSKSLQKIALQGDRLKSIFTGVIPPQPDGTVLVYCIYAKDNEGNESITPLQAVTIGRNKAHSVALLAGRELTGDMRNDPLWNGTGHGTIATSAIDTCSMIYGRPGTYSVWALAAPRDRGITVKVERKSTAASTNDLLMNGTINANQPDGWYRVGGFTIQEGTKLNVSVMATGFAGYAGYGEVILTQDKSFSPPAKNVLIDWVNGLSITGIENGMVLTRPITINAFATGNIDAIHLTTKREGNGVSNGGTKPMTVSSDGHLVLDPADLVSGDYIIVISGDAMYMNGNTPITSQLVQKEFIISLPK
ncbi:MAG: hypothetical protein WCO98_04500 [bacterium]